MTFPCPTRHRMSNPHDDDRSTSVATERDAPQTPIKGKSVADVRSLFRKPKV
jgi:hypothetical protein